MSLEGAEALPLRVTLGQEGYVVAELLERIAKGVETTGQKTKEAGEKSEKAAKGWSDSLKDVGEKYTYIVGMVSDLARRITEAAESASQVDRLAEAQRDLGVSFEESARQAGGYVAQTEVMNATQQLAARDLHLTQTEVNALARVAQDYARGSGKDFRGVVEQLSEAVAKGGEELGRFGGQLAPLAQGSHTAQERLNALVQRAADLSPAAQTAGERVAALRGQLEQTERVATHAFIQGILEVERLGHSTDETGARFEILTSDITTAGHTIGMVLGGVTNGIAVVVGGAATAVSATISTVIASFNALEVLYDRASSRQFSGSGAAAAAAFTASINDSPITEALARFTSERAAAANRIADETLAYWGAQRDAGTGGPRDGTIQVRGDARDTAARARRTGSSSGSDDDAKSAKAAQMAADQAERDRALAQMRVDRDFYGQLVRSATEYERAMHGAAVAWGEQATHADELARIQARIAGLSNEGTAANEVRLQRAQAGQQRAEGRVGRRAELEDLRDPAVQEERGRDAAEQRQVDRERRALDRRIDAQQSFTERWRDLHSQQADATAMSVETINGALTSMGSSLAKHFQLMVAGKETIGEALRGMTSDTLLALSQQAAVKGAMEIAEGIAALAGVYTAALAPGHFAAGAAYLGVAALAGLGGAALAPSASSAPSAASGSTPGVGQQRDERLGPARAMNDNSGAGGVVYNINFNSQLYGLGGAREAARTVVRTINRGGLQGGVQLAPGTLQATGSGA